MQSIQIRQLTDKDVPGVHDLFDELKWSLRHEDLVRITFPLGTGVKAVDIAANDKLVGCAFAYIQGSYSSIGGVVVLPAYKRRGIGRELMDACVALSSATPLLIETAEGSFLYDSIGFKEYNQVLVHVNHDWPGTLKPFETDVEIRPYQTQDWDRVLEIAQAGAGFDRSAILKHLLPISLATVVCVVQSRIVAYATIYRYKQGYVIGPVVAQTPNQVIAMLGFLLRQNSDTLLSKFIRIDIHPEPTIEAWLADNDFKAYSRDKCKALGPSPTPRDKVKQYAIMNQAIG